MTHEGRARSRGPAAPRSSTSPRASCQGRLDRRRRTLVAARGDGSWSCSRTRAAYDLILAPASRASWRVRGPASANVLAFRGPGETRQRFPVRSARSAHGSHADDLHPSDAHRLAHLRQGRRRLRRALEPPRRRAQRPPHAELDLSRGERVADLACGTGLYTVEMARLVAPGRGGGRRLLGGDAGRRPRAGRGRGPPLELVHAGRRTSSPRPRAAHLRRGLPALRARLPRLGATCCRASAACVRARAAAWAC